jgi:hypothetical protein
MIILLISSELTLSFKLIINVFNTVLYEVTYLEPVLHRGLRVRMGVYVYQGLVTHRFQKLFMFLS